MGAEVVLAAERCSIHDSHACVQAVDVNACYAASLSLWRAADSIGRALHTHVCADALRGGSTGEGSSLVCSVLISCVSVCQCFFQRQLTVAWKLSS